MKIYQVHSGAGRSPEHRLLAAWDQVSVRATKGISAVLLPPGDACMLLCCSGNPDEKVLARAFLLAFADEGERVRIVGLRDGQGLMERLLSIGIRVEDEIAVLHRQHGGTILIGREANRFTLGGGMALTINVVRC